MSIILKVSVQDLVDSLFRSNLTYVNRKFPYIEGVFMLGEHVDKSYFACLLGETPNHIAVGIAPPWDCEGNLIPLGVRLSRSQVKVAALRAVNLSGV